MDILLVLGEGKTFNNHRTDNMLITTLLVLAGATYIYLVVKEFRVCFRTTCLLNKAGFFPEPPTPGLRWVPYAIPMTLYMVVYCLFSVFVDFFAGVLGGTLFKSRTEEEIQDMANAIITRSQQR
jgi:hypothetical protein